jgi:hypothetical protein
MPEDIYDVAYGEDEQGRGYLAVYNKTQGKFKRLEGMSKTEARQEAANLERKLVGWSARVRAYKTGETKEEIPVNLKESSRTKGRLQENHTPPSSPGPINTQTQREPVGSSSQSNQTQTATTSPAIAEVVKEPKKRQRSRKPKSSSQSLKPTPGPQPTLPQLVEPTAPTMPTLLVTKAL